APGGHCDHAAPPRQLEGIAAVAPKQGGLDHVHADDHSGTATVGRVVDLTGAERSGRPQVDRLELVVQRERIANVPLAPEPVEPAGEERDDVDPHSPRNRLSTSMTSPTERIASETNGRSVPSSSSSRSQEGAWITRW